MSNNELPLISIIIPAYNAQDTITYCVRSCIIQTYSNIEIVIVNDGSKDDTLKICQELADNDKRISVCNSENKGVCSARNIGIENSKGEYITFLDADDELTEDAIEVLYKNIENSDIAIGNYCYKRDESLTSNDYIDVPAYWTGTQGLVKSLEDNPATYSCWAKLFRKELVGDTRFVVGKRIHEDSFFIFQLMCKKPRVYVSNDYIYHYIMNANSASHSAYSTKFRDMFYFAQLKKEIIENNFPELCNLLPNLIIKVNMRYLGGVSMRTFIAEDKIYEKNCLREIKKLKSHFIPATEYDEKFFKVIAHNMYYPYKFATYIADYILRKIRKPS